MDDAVWDVTVFTKNRDRLLEAEVARKFFELVVEQAYTLNLMSDEHFTVDGMLLEACAGLKSFHKRGEAQTTPDHPGNPTINFHGEERNNNQTHASTTDPGARLARKGGGKEAKLSYTGHVLMENRNGMVVVNVEVLPATGTAEKEAALSMIESISGDHRITVGADKGYDTKGFVEESRKRNATPHVAQNNNGRRSAIDGRTTRHAGYAESQKSVRDLRMDKDHRWNAQASPSRTGTRQLDVHNDRSYIQPCAPAQPGHGGCWSKCMRSSVSTLAHEAQNDTEKKGKRPKDCRLD